MTDHIISLFAWLCLTPLVGGQATAAVTGGFNMSVTNASYFVKDAQVEYGVKMAIAKLAGMNETTVDVRLSLVARRLESASPPRLLSATGTVDVSYTINAPAIGGAGSAADVQNRLAAVSKAALNTAVTNEVVAASSTFYTTNILSIKQSTITGGSPQAPDLGGVVLGAYNGIWKGPPAEGASGFKGKEIGIIAAVTVVVAFILAAVAAYKHDMVEGAVEKSFEATGALIARRPILVITITITLACAISSGMAMQKAESDPAKLWVPKGSVSLDHSQYTKDYWSSGIAPTLMVVSPKEGGANILTAQNLQSLLRVHNEILAIKVDGSKIVEDSKGIADYTQRYGGIWTFDGRDGTRGKCAKWGPVCAVQNVLAIFDYNSTLITDEAGIKDRIAKWDNATIQTMVPGLGIYKSFEIADVLGGVKKDGSGHVVSAEAFFWIMQHQQDEQEVEINGDRAIADPVVMEWEADAVCILGVMKEHPTKKDTDCSQPSGDLEYSGLFTRSFSDEFGQAIRGDIAGIGAAYAVIIVYLFINLGKRDSVHSMVAMSFGCLACVGLSYVGGTGLGSFFGVKNNPLNNNIPFLILGLGVDDAFVLVAELTRHAAQDKEASIETLIAATAKTGGASVLVTSLTDALAFLVGASTALPALSAFCIYAGISVILCFLFQIFLFLPLLAINLRRTRANRFDLLCCFKSKEQHEIDKPKGCCFCIWFPQLNPPDGLLPKAFERLGNKTVKTMPGKAGTLAFWLAVFAVGIGGIAQIKKDFKLEWFFPSGSYTKKFIDLNDQYFSEGTTFRFYTNDVDLFAQQAEMNEFTSYINQISVIKQSSLQNWWPNFRSKPTVSSAGTTSADFYTELWAWFGTSAFKDSILWKDGRCNSKDATVSAKCDPTQGVAHTQISATLRRLGDGPTRFQTVNQMRLDINKIFKDDSGMKAFPFSSNFLYWEEMGIIDTELARNLIIAAGIVFIIICILIPRPRIACIVSLCICMSIVELVGFMHWWGVTVNGTTTIYLLICLGLSVDYSVHIAHIFKESSGSMEERAIGAMTRIGPSVFHALLSTILAVIVLARSKSYIFEIFFKVLFLVTMIAGFKGLWLLPVVLSIVGGSKEKPQDVNESHTKDHQVPQESSKLPKVTDDQEEKADVVYA